MAPYSPLKVFNSNACQIRLRTLKSMLWIGERRRAKLVLHHTIVDLISAEQSNLTADERTDLVDLFSKVGISILDDQTTMADYEIRDIDYYLNRGEHYIKERMLKGDIDADYGAFASLPADLMREIGSYLA